MPFSSPQSWLPGTGWVRADVAAPGVVVAAGEELGRAGRVDVVAQREDFARESHRAAARWPGHPVCEQSAMSPAPTKVTSPPITGPPCRRPRTPPAPLRRRWRASGPSRSRPIARTRTRIGSRPAGSVKLVGQRVGGGAARRHRHVDRQPTAARRCRRHPRRRSRAPVNCRPLPPLSWKVTAPRSSKRLRVGSPVLMRRTVGDDGDRLALMPAGSGVGVGPAGDDPPPQAPKWVARTRASTVARVWRRLVRGAGAKRGRSFATEGDPTVRSNCGNARGRCGRGRDRAVSAKSAGRREVGRLAQQISRAETREIDEACHLDNERAVVVEGEPIRLHRRRDLGRTADRSPAPATRVASLAAGWRRSSAHSVTAAT